MTYIVNNGNIYNMNKTSKKINEFCTKELGKLGEDISKNYLEAKGYKVIENNFRCKIGEIDIIASKEKLLAFVEVKTRRSLMYGYPQEAVNTTKIKYIKKVASYYLSQKMRIQRIFSDFSFRFDVIEINFINEEYEINHIEDAF